MNEMKPSRGRLRTEDVAAISRSYDRVALVLQGGGALGAYQIGVFQALRKPASSRTGFPASRSARSIPRSSPAIARKTG